MESRAGYNCEVFGKEVYIYSQKKDDDLSIEYWYDDELKWKIELRPEDEYQSISIWSHEALCFFAYDGKIEVRLKENGKLLYYKVQTKLSFGNNFFVEFRRSKEDRKRGDLSLHKITETGFLQICDLSDIAKMSFFNIDSHLFGYSNEHIESLNEKKWQQTFIGLTKSDKANLHSQILNCNEKLFFGIDGNENRGIYVLDVETGKVLRKFDTESYEIFRDEDYIYTTKFQNILYRINTKTLQLEEWDCNALILENGFRSIHDHRCKVVNGKFCFTQSLGDNKAKLGVLDWEKKELVYKHDFEPQNGAIGSIHLSETRMFVHTQDNILHIFEKE